MPRLAGKSAPVRAAHLFQKHKNFGLNKNMWKDKMYLKSVGKRDGIGGL